MRAPFQILVISYTEGVQWVCRWCWNTSEANVSLLDDLAE